MCQHAQLMTSLDPVESELRQSITGSHYSQDCIAILPQIYLLKSTSAYPRLTGDPWAPLVPFPMHMERHLLSLLFIIIFSVEYWHQLPAQCVGAATAGLLHYNSNHSTSPEGSRPKDLIAYHKQFHMPEIEAYWYFQTHSLREQVYIITFHWGEFFIV